MMTMKFIWFTAQDVRTVLGAGEMFDDEADSIAALLVKKASRSTSWTSNGYTPIAASWKTVTPSSSWMQ